MNGLCSDYKCHAGQQKYFPTGPQCIPEAHYLEWDIMHGKWRICKAGIRCDKSKSGQQAW